MLDPMVLSGFEQAFDALLMGLILVEFVRAFFQASKPVATTCHGPWTIIEAGMVRGRRIASWPSLKTDLRNAGAECG